MDDSSLMDSTRQELNVTQSRMATLKIDQDNGNQNIVNYESLSGNESGLLSGSGYDSGQSGNPLTNELSSLLQSSADDESSQCIQDLKDNLANVVLKKTMQCFLCKDIMIKATITSCSHTFCGYCIQTWLIKDKNCPICKTRITDTIKPLSLDSFSADLYNLIGGTYKEQRNIALSERARLQNACGGETGIWNKVPEDDDKI